MVFRKKFGMKFSAGRYFALIRRARGAEKGSEDAHNRARPAGFC